VWTAPSWPRARRSGDSNSDPCRVPHPCNGSCDRLGFPDVSRFLNHLTFFHSSIVTNNLDCEYGKRKLPGMLDFAPSKSEFLKPEKTLAAYQSIPSNSLISKILPLSDFGSRFCKILTRSPHHKSSSGKKNWVCRSSGVPLASVARSGVLVPAKPIFAVANGIKHPFPQRLHL
jgi:hypothetical protein